jgi:hypothetical protein
LPGKTKLLWEGAVLDGHQAGMCTSSERGQPLKVAIKGADTTKHVQQCGCVNGTCAVTVTCGAGKPFAAAAAQHAQQEKAQNRRQSSPPETPLHNLSVGPSCTSSMAAARLAAILAAPCMPRRWAPNSWHSLLCKATTSTYSIRLTQPINRAPPRVDAQAAAQAPAGEPARH